MLHFSISPLEIPRSFFKNRSLIWQMSKREIVGKYRGSILGILWSFVNPLLMLSMYTIVFGYVFQSRWGMQNESKMDFALALFIGLSVFQLFSESFQRSPSLIVSNANYVKKVVFPLEVYSFISLLTSIFHVGLNFLLILLFFIISKSQVPHLIFLLPIALLPLLFFCLGITWFLSALGVFFRDLQQIISFGNTILLFLSPIFFPLEKLPVFLQKIAILNPLTFPLEWARGLILYNQFPNILQYLIFLMSSIVFTWIGFVFFQKTRKGFADVL